MSGGHWDYIQGRLDYEVAAELHQFAVDNSRGYSGATLARFLVAEMIVREAAIVIQRVDWLISGDDGEDDFVQRWDEEMVALRELLGVVHDEP
jgi:hypothetical protein